MNTPSSVPSTAAVLLHESKPVKGILYGFITHSYAGSEPVTTVHRLASTDDLNMLMVDRFLMLWAELEKSCGPINFYTTSPVLRSLLNEQGETYSSLQVRNLVVGTGLNEQWDSAKGSCRKALENLLEDKVYRERRITLSRPPHHVIVGTDASKSYSTETGWGFATSDGRLSSGVINTTDIGRGEFYAVTCAVEKYQDTECKVLDVLTDSWEVYKTINNPASRPLDRVKQHAVHCLDAIAYARRHDLEVRVHWVRGHCGNLLNEHADRAAMNARRCRNWDLGKTHTRFMEHQIRRDLRDAISAVSVDYLMPSFTAGDAVEAVAA